MPREEARRRIVEATARLLGRSRFRDLTVDVVMREAGLSRTVFYRYFDGLAHVVISLLDDLIDQIVDLNVAAGRPGDPEVLRAGLQRTVEEFDQHGPLMRGLVEAAAVDAEIEEAYRAVVERSVDAMAAQIAEGIAEGRLREVSPRNVARALTLMNGYYLLDALGHDPDADTAVVWRPVDGVGGGARDEQSRREAAAGASTSRRPERKAMTVLVTGGTGHLGRAIAALLRRDGHAVRVLARRPGDDPQLEWLRGDLATGHGVAEAVSGVETVIHAATNSPAAQRGGFRPSTSSTRRETSTSPGPSACWPQPKTSASSTSFTSRSSACSRWRA